MSSLLSIWEGNGQWAFSRGFYPSPLEIVLTFLVLVGLFVFLVMSSRHQLRHERLRKIQADTHRYLLELKRFSFSPGELMLLDRLSEFLPGGVPKADLLARPDVFRHCEEKIVRNGGIPPVRVLAAVRMKLGFTIYRSGREVKSTTEIPPGTKLYCENQNSIRFSGVLVRIRPRDVIIRLSDGDLPPIGSPLDAMFSTREGKYTFSTFVVFCEYPHVYLEHAVINDRRQQRLYFRKELYTPVTIRNAGKGGRIWNTMLIEISGGGCSFVNPDKCLSQGASVEVLLNDANGVSLSGRVIRVSRNNGVCHLKFVIRKEPDRDRLIRYIKRVS